MGRIRRRHKEDKKLRAKEREMEDIDGYEFEDNAPSTWNGID